MKRFLPLIIALVLFCAVPVSASLENGGVSSIRDLVITDKKPFSFRNGIQWGMNPQQISVIENVPMRTSMNSGSDWSIMVTESPVSVSRFSADLVYIFRQNALQMITYEFWNDCSTLYYQYLTGALSSLYGEAKNANPAMIKGLIDQIDKDHYKQDLITRAYEWNAPDGTSIYLYYITENNYAILYVCPGSNYDTNGL